MPVAKTTTMKWNNLCVDRYIALGYTFTKMRDTFEVKVSDLPRQSSIKIHVKCESCGIETKVPRLYLKDHLDTYYCKKCHDTRRRYNYEIVKTKFAEKGYTLVSTEYKNVKHKLKFICCKHPDLVQEITFMSILKGSSCIRCSIEKSRHKYEDVVAAFAERGYTLMSTAYKNLDTYLEYVCPKHPESVQKITYHNFLHGAGCRLCGLENAANKNKVPWDKIREKFAEFGYILIEGQEYLGYDKPLFFICPKHPDKEVFVSYHSLCNNGSKGCFYCNQENRRGENSARWNGGISEISDCLKKKVDPWRAASYTHHTEQCIVSGNLDDLQIHHYYVPFVTIRDETFEVTGIARKQTLGEYTNEEIDELSRVILSKHFSYGYGVPVNKTVHMLFHAIYGKYDNTPEQFEEFKQRYLSGEFDDQGFVRKAT